MPNQLGVDYNAHVIESILKHVAHTLDVPLEKVVVTLDRFGNTGCASIPISLAEADGLMIVPPEAHGAAAGETLQVIPLDPSRRLLTALPTS